MPVLRCFKYYTSYVTGQRSTQVSLIVVTNLLIVLNFIINFVNVFLYIMKEFSIPFYYITVQFLDMAYILLTFDCDILDFQMTFVIFTYSAYNFEFTRSIILYTQIVEDVNNVFEKFCCRNHV